MLDEDAFDHLLDVDPDAALCLLAEAATATDAGLRELARRLAGRVVVDLARRGAEARRGVGRLRRRPMDRAGGDLDLDSSLDELAGARAAGRPPDVAQLVATAWERPSTAVCLLVDRSGSMFGERLAAATLAAAAVTLRSPADCSVVAFSQDAVVLASHGVARPTESIVGDLLTLRGHGVTDLDLALRVAADQLSRSRAGRRLTLLLSDCRPTAGPDPLSAAVALDELSILAPADDLEDATRFAASAGARCTPLEGPASVVAALNAAFDQTAG